MAVLSLIGCRSSSTPVSTAEAVALEYSAQDVSAEIINGSTQDHNSDSGTAGPGNDISEEAVDSSESENTTVNLPDDFWVDMSCTYTDSDGYVVEKKVKLSKMISMDSPQIAKGTWSELGGVEADIPDLSDCKETSRYWNDFNWETGYYIMGTVEYTNKTNGFSFTNDKPHNMALRSLNDYFGDSLGILTNEAGGMPVADSFPSSFTRAFLPNGIKNYGPGSDFYENASGCLLFTPIKMSSDSWGPVRFIICIPDTHTPKNPEGFPELNELFYQIIDNEQSTMVHTGEEFQRVHIEKYN